VVNRGVAYGFRPVPFRGLSLSLCFKIWLAAWGSWVWRVLTWLYSKVQSSAV